MRLTLLMLMAVAAFAQADTNTITITASRNISVSPDQLQYNVTVVTDATAALSDAVALLGGTGITASSLSYVSANAGSANWSFSLVVPVSKMKDTGAALAKAQQQAGVRNGLPVVTYAVSSAQTSDAAQSQACQLNALLSDARREADRVASAAGVKVGGIVGLGEGAGVPTAVARSAVFGVFLDPSVGSPISNPNLPILANPLLGAYYSSPPPLVPCSLVVRFQLLP
jgi:uncharacterized protein YggE